MISKKEIICPENLLRLAKSKGPVKAVIVNAVKLTAIESAKQAVNANLIAPIFIGDKSLSSRPMDRVLKPLLNFGSNYSLRKDNYLPAILKGSDNPIPFSFELGEPSAQIKSAVLLGALNTPGVTKIKDKCIKKHKGGGEILNESE